MSTPIFVNVGGRTLNATQIKWVGVKDEKVYVEFITGGWTVLEPDITLGQFRTALDDAVTAAAPL